MYVLTEWLLSFNWQRFTLHKNEKRNLELYRKNTKFYELIELPSYIVLFMPLWKRAYSKYIENFTTKTWKFSDKNSDIFHISAQNIDCRYSLEPPWWGSFNEYPQSMVLSRNKKNNVYLCKPQFYYIKVGFKGVKIIFVCFCDALLLSCKKPI